MNTDTQPKRGRGRPVGGISLVNVTLAELIAKYSPDQVLPVGRLFLEKGAAPRTITQAEIKESTDIVNSMTNNSMANMGSIADNGQRVEMTLQA